VTNAVTRGDAVQMIGFEPFAAGDRAERWLRNPWAGETVAIPAAKTIRFTTGNAFEDIVNAV